MLATRSLFRGPVSVVEYRCTATPDERPFPERHEGWSVSFVQHGSFGCRCEGRHHELVPGSLLIGSPGDEYTCTHDHHRGGDVCLAIFLSASVTEETTRGRFWRSGAMPPLPELMVHGELVRAAAEGESDLGVDEAALGLVERFVRVEARSSTARPRVRPRDRRRAVEAALWIEAHAHAEEPPSLATLATRAGLSPFHFLRTFSSVLEVTPHQYLVRCRVRRAAQLLTDADRPITDVALEAGFADLSNFVRTFGRAAGLSPGKFRRKILQERRRARS